MRRLRLIAPAIDVTERAGPLRPSSVVVRRPAPDRAEEASDVLVEAYRSADDTLEGDGDQLDRFWAGEWGPPVPPATMCARQAPNGEIVGLSLVCLLDGLPLVPISWSRNLSVGTVLLPRSSLRQRAVCWRKVSTRLNSPSTRRTGAHSTSTRLGFRLDAPGCRHRSSDGRPWIGYTVPPAFDGLRAALIDALPGLDEAPNFVVGIHDTATSEVLFPFPNTSTGHRLPGWILALVTGWRSGEFTTEMSAREFDTAIALLSPVESATMFDHPNLEAWRAMRDGAAEDATFAVRFSSSSDYPAKDDVR